MIAFRGLYSRSSRIARLGVRLCALVGAWARASEGGVAVTVAVSIVALVGMLALSIDVGRIYNAHTERNNAADAAAIAAATELHSGPGSCARAIDAAIRTELRNQETFVSNRTGPNVYINANITDALNPGAESSIRFLSELVHDSNGNVTDTYIYGDETVCDETASYVEVVTDQVSDTEEAEVDLYFAGLTGALTQAFPRGYAVAQNVEVFCSNFPMFMCPLDSGASAAQFWADLKNGNHTGKGVQLKNKKNNEGFFPGVLGFLRLANTGANELGLQLGMVNPPPNCIGTGEIYTEPGGNESAARAFDSRMGIYHNGGDQDPFSPNWQPSRNAVKGFMQGNRGICNMGNEGYHDPEPVYSGDGTDESMALPQTAMPFPFDFGHYPGGACDGQRLCDGNWDSDAYFTLNHSDGTFTPLDVTDFDGNGLMTRYEVYLSEMDRPMHWVESCNSDLAADGIMTLKPNYDAGSSWNYLGPNHHLVNNGPLDPEGEAADVGVNQCGTVADMPTPWWAPNDRLECGYQDRRVVDVLLIDCDALEGSSGSFNVPYETIIGSVKVFVVQGWNFGWGSGGDHDLYVEIIGPGDAGNDPPLVAKNWVVLNESRNALK